MFDDLDKEMKRRRLDTVLVIGESTLGNPELAYVAGTAIPRGGIFFKIGGQQPLLVVSNIDVGSAKRGRIRDVRTYSDYGYERLLKRYGPETGYVKLIELLLQSLGSRRRIGIYSRNEFSHLLSITDSLRKLGYKASGETGTSLIESLRETKDPAEIAKLQDTGARAARVIEGTLQMLRKCTVASAKLKLKSKTLTIGMVKSRISVLLAEQDLVAPEGTVFAVGSCSADPHEVGPPAYPVRVNVPIVFDLFPVGPSGYWSDLTRTYVVGKAPAKVKRMFETVREVQLEMLDFVREGTEASMAMNSACDRFQQLGFKTIRDMLKGDRDAGKSGFIHSLGHGVGLTIGERPYLSSFSSDKLRKNQVVTVEPGLYEPGVGGVRIEDTVVIKKRCVDNLTPLGKELVV